MNLKWYLLDTIDRLRFKMSLNIKIKIFYSGLAAKTRPI